jgi:hypothetical protein
MFMMMTMMSLEIYAKLQLGVPFIWDMTPDLDVSKQRNTFTIEGQ